MKKRVLRFTSWLLILCMVFVVAGCGASGSTGGGSSKEEKEEKTVVGTWKCEVDMTDYFYDSYIEGAGEEIGKYFEFSRIALMMVLEINEDGTIVGTYDEESISNFSTTLLSDMKTGMQKYLEASLEGTGVTVDEALAQSNTTIEKMVEDSFNVEELKEEMSKTFLEAEYEVDEDKMYILLDEEDKEASYFVFELDEDTLNIKETVGLDETDFAEMTLPLEFERQ